MKTFAKKTGIALCYIAAWELISLAVGRALVFPSPVETARALFVLLGTARFYETVGMTLLRVVTGFALGVLAGTAFGVLTAFSQTADALLAPLRTIVKATPVTSFIILVLLWLTSALTPTFIAFLMVTPIVWASVRAGLLSADPLLVEMAQFYRVPRMRRFVKLYVPSAMPQFAAACTTGLGFAWKSGVAAEVIASTELSIGRSLNDCKIYLETPELFAWTAAVIILSMVLEKGMVRLLRRFSHDKL